MPTKSETKGKKRKERQNKLIEKTKSGKVSMDPKQVRARARRHERMVRDAMEVLYKPVSEWDVQELAKGRPRNIDGNFGGPSPQWVSREVHEEAMRRFIEVSRSGVQALVPLAIDTVEMILRADGVDKRGRALVPAGVRLDAAKWLVEHVIGKPTQRKEVDISVKLAAVLGSVMVNPADAVYAVGGGEGLEAIADTDQLGGVPKRIALPNGGGEYIPAMLRSELWADPDDDPGGDDSGDSD